MHARDTETKTGRKSFCTKARERDRIRDTTKVFLHTTSMHLLDAMQMDEEDNQEDNGTKRRVAEFFPCNSLYAVQIHAYVIHVYMYI